MSVRSRGEPICAIRSFPDCGLLNVKVCSIALKSSANSDKSTRAANPAARVKQHNITQSIANNPIYNVCSASLRTERGHEAVVRPLAYASINKQLVCVRLLRCH